jgi:hypothetical protein
MSGERHVRRWVLLAFGATVGGGCARTAVEFARALDCFHAGRDAEARALFASVAAARPADPEPADYLERLAARAGAAGRRADGRGRGGRRGLRNRNIAPRGTARCDDDVTCVSTGCRRR